MSTLLVGFDAAWSAKNQGALVGTFLTDDGRLVELGPPQAASYPDAQFKILDWQTKHVPEVTIVMLDQPTIVKNANGQRPVENLVSSSVGRRRGGMQPANTAKVGVFGHGAPIWPFLSRFGGPADPLGPTRGTLVFETYPVLLMIALGWTLHDSRASGRLPKYNPARIATFSLSDWQYVCNEVTNEFRRRELLQIVDWLGAASRCSAPSKSEQDNLDACLCLLAALYLMEQRDCLLVGSLDSGYIVAPYGRGLSSELEDRCRQTGRVPSEWVRRFRLPTKNTSSRNPQVRPAAD